VIERTPLYTGILKKFVRDAEIQWGLETEAVKEKKARIVSDLYYLGREIIGNDWLGEIHKDLSDKLKGKWERALFLIPREHLKSTFITQYFTVQQILKNPDVRFLISSETATLSEAFLSSIKKILMMPEIVDLFGEQKGEKWSADAITVAGRRNPSIKEATIMTCGVDKAITGFHFDFIIHDDIVGSTNVGTPEQLKKTFKYYKDSLSLLDKKVGRLLMNGTVWHNMDCYNIIIKNHIKEFQIFERREVDQHGGVEKDIIYPERFTPDKIAQLKSDLTEYEFNCQYRNKAKAADKDDFKEEWWQSTYYDDLPTQSHYNVAITVDPAISRERGRHNSGIVVSCMDELGEVYLDRAIRKHMKPPEMLDILFELHRKYDALENVDSVTVGVETIGFQEMISIAATERMEREDYYFTIEDLKPKHNSKIDRIRALQSWYKRLKIHHKRGECEDIEEELLWLGEGSHPDIADALAYAIKLWVRPGSAKNKEEKSESAQEFEAACAGTMNKGAHWYENPSGYD
jgi:hypothetical protein